LGDRTAARIEELEARWGVSLPADYRAFLLGHNEPQRRRDEVVTSNPDYWGVANLFELGEGPAYLQLDEVLRLVGDVVPPMTVPVAADEGGNFFMLDCSPNGSRGSVAWWDHEREPGDDSMDLVAPSFTAFRALIGPED